MFMSDRVFILVLDVVDKDDGTTYIVQTSRGTEEVAVSLKDKVGDDVLAVQDFQVTKIKDTDAGLDMKTAGQVDMNGSIPSFLQSKMQGKQLKRIENQAYMMINGKKPEGDD